MFYGQIAKLAQETRKRNLSRRLILALTTVCLLALPMMAQNAPYYSPEQLDHLVSPIALYPDPLLAQVLAAATFPDQIPDAARWSDQHHYLSGPELAEAIQSDQLPWDPSVQALLPFPSVLDHMASDMRWTSDLGNAFLGNQQDVMYAVQRMRQRARDYGYLRTGPQIIVAGGPFITIMPARPDYIVVPYYDPYVVYARPRPGFVLAAAISFRFGVGVGVAFRPWGWGYNRIAWDRRVIVINNSPWHRDWHNRNEYVHPYTIRRTVVVRDHDWRDHHELVERSEREREGARFGHERTEEHKKIAEGHGDRHHEDNGRREHGDHGDHDDRR